MDHPRVQLAVVLAAALSAPWLQPGALALVAVTALGWHGFLGRTALASLGRSLWRLKWLLLAIGLVFLWLPDDTGSTRLVPDWARAAEGLHRAAVVAVMMTVVHGLVYRHSAAVLGAVLAGILAPLERLGLPGRRFGIRLGMLLEQVGPEREHLAGIRREAAEGFHLRAVPALLAREIQRIEQSPEPDPAPWPEIPAASWLARIGGAVLIAGLVALLGWQAL